MNRLYILLVITFSLSLSTLQAQDETWFKDVTADVGFVDVPAWRLYVSDVNGDEYPDLLIVNGIYKRNQLSLWLNVPDIESGDPSDRYFIDITEESGINANPNPSIDGRVADVGALADVDNDGDVDLVTGRFYYAADSYTMPEDQAAVLLNDGTGKFTLVDNSGLAGTSEIPEKLNATNMGFLDYNLDGDLDLYVGTFSLDHGASVYMHDYLYQGNGNGTFTDVSTESNIGSIAQPLYGANACDWNNDGWPDVITAPYCRTSGSLWRNNGNGTFTDVALETGYSAWVLRGDRGQTLCQWEAMPADFDNDGDMDILQVMVHGGYHTGEGRTVIAINHGEANNYSLTWDLKRIDRDAPTASHLGDMSGSWIDVDGDGWLDLIITQSQYPDANYTGVERTYILRQGEDNYFTDITEDVGLKESLLEPSATELIDYDLDGDDDLLIVINSNKNKDNTLHLIESTASERNNWVAVKLKAPQGVNQDAIGARIMVTAGGVTQMQEVFAGQGHFGGQQPLVRNFGIGQNESIERIEVRWPSQSVENTVVENPPINQTITIEGAISSVEGKAYQPRQMQVVPNPARNLIRLQLPEGASHNGRVVITSPLGKEMISLTAEAGSRTIEVSVEGLAAGYYIVRLEGDEQTYSAPFIVE